MSHIVVIKRPRKKQRKTRKYGRRRPYIKNNKIYFGGKLSRGSGIPLLTLIGNLAKGLFEI